MNKTKGFLNAPATIEGIKYPVGTTIEYDLASDDNGIRKVRFNGSNIHRVDVSDLTYIVTG